ncbi:MAG: hypothetical protein HYS32_01115 [Candidatus Woesearchaeota archaeon]|nr:MAG: hypothetical protein HYS32_01115 [Candidatus Woesearchaeota archaeon]
MTTLIACLSTGKGTWGHVGRLITDGKWDKIFLITNDFGKENFTPEKPSEFIIADAHGSLKDMRDLITKELKGKIKDTEVGVNLVSGTGKEHMAIISALLKLGLGIRLMALTKDGIEEV